MTIIPRTAATGNCSVYYCHDNEHQRDQVGAGVDEAPSNRELDRPFTPFAQLANLRKRHRAA